MIDHPVLQVRIIRRLLCAKTYKRLLTMAKDRTVCCILFTESPVPVEIPKGVPMYLNIASGRTTALHFGPWYFSGLRLWGAPHLSLADLFDSNKARVTGSKSDEGVDCIVVEAATGNWEYTFMLDPTRDFLPRKQTAKMAGAVTSPQTLISAEFQQFDEGAGNLRWMQTTGRAVSDILLHHYGLTALQLNTEYTDADFVIDAAMLPASIQVNEGSGKTWYTQGREDLFRSLEQLTDRRDAIMEQRFAAANSGVPTTASKNPIATAPVRIPQASIQWPSIIAVISGLVLISLGGYKWWKQRAV